MITYIIHVYSRLGPAVPFVAIMIGSIKVIGCMRSGWWCQHMKRLEGTVESG